MAGGDKAKASGEYGEKIVANLLKLLGWNTVKNSLKIPCIYNEKHKKNDRTQSVQHGADYLFNYRCPLRDSSRHDILISVKCRNGYPAKESTIVKVFKKFLVEIAHAIECYPASNEYKAKIRGAKKRKTSGLIFWIDRNQNDGKEYESIVDKIGLFYLKEECMYDTICLIDNKRAQFIFEAISYAHKKYGKHNVKFFYIDTGLNNANLYRLFKGSIMPFEYINSDVIPFAINDNDNDVLLLVINDSFNEDYLTKLIGLSQELTNTWSSKVVIAFPDFNSFEHNNFVNSAKSKFRDDNFIEKLTVTTYKPDFRDEV